MPATKQPRPSRPMSPVTAPAAPSPAESSVSDLIDRARSAPPPRRGALVLTFCTAMLLWAAFHPLDWGPLAWIAPVPLLLLARIRQRTRWMYGCVYLGGAAYWIPTLQWMRLGDVTMIPAWLALSLYLALYFPAMLGMTRLAVHRLRVPLVLAAPVAWVGLEYLRTHLMTGFGWYLAGHSQHEFTTLVQVCDLFGAYGVSFLVLLAAAAVSECVPAAWFTTLRLLPPVCDIDAAVLSAGPRRRACSVLGSLLLVAAAILYGGYRMEHAEFPTGPRVALIQGDFRSEVKHDPDAARDIYMKHLHLTGLTVPYRPDVIIWPETMFPYVLHHADPQLSRAQLVEQFPETDPEVWRDPRRNVGAVLRDRAEQAGARLIVGVVAFVASQSGPARYNSAVFVEPQVGITARYDKLHRVPFGEYIPLQDWLPFLKAFSPFGSESGIAAGSEVDVFKLNGARLLPLICFEDTVPHLVRRMVNAAASADADRAPGNEPVDCLVNLTNDGWFRGSSEQEQHLVTAAFRCIETRTPMVRAVNTGISAVIDGDGVVREPIAFIDGDRHPSVELAPREKARETLRDPTTGEFHKALNAALVANVPLDPRGSLYLWWGDWFAAACLVLSLGSLGWTAVPRPRLPIA